MTEGWNQTLPPMARTSWQGNLSDNDASFEIGGEHVNTIASDSDTGRTTVDLGDGIIAVQVAYRIHCVMLSGGVSDTTSTWEVRLGRPQDTGTQLMIRHTWSSPAPHPSDGSTDRIEGGLTDTILVPTPKQKLDYQLKVVGAADDGEIELVIRSKLRVA